MIVKSTGWKGLLPRPSSTATSSNAGYPPATEATRQAAANTAKDANITGRAPQRSTRKPVLACPTPETTKKTDINSPICA